MMLVFVILVGTLRVTLEKVRKRRKFSSKTKHDQLQKIEYCKICKKSQGFRREEEMSNSMRSILFSPQGWHSPS